MSSSKSRVDGKLHPNVGHSAKDSKLDGTKQPVRKSRWDAQPDMRTKNVQKDTTERLSLSIGLKRSSDSASNSTETKKAQSTAKSQKLALSLAGVVKEKDQKTAPIAPNLLSRKVHEVFNDDSDEEEDIPEEYKIRMRNKGRDNPVACGPNSYGKSRLGFCDYRSMQERDLEDKAKELCDE